jgi:SAM-dependent methyltransferase
MTQTTLDARELESFLGRAVGDMGASISALLIHLGDRLGLYRAMQGAGPLTSNEVAARTGTLERYVREWLNNQAAGGYVRYHADSGRYELTAEQAACLADETSPSYVLGAFESIASLWADERQSLESFTSGRAIGWHEHDPRLFSGTERFFRPGYIANLVSAWLPALDGVLAKLERGARVADVGCGHGASTLVMARAFPNSSFVGFDSHAASVECARRQAAEQGLGERVRFEVASGKDFPAQSWDLVAYFDCLHDMGDPIGAARHARSTLAPDGTIMLVEPFAHDRTEQNLNPVGRVFYGFSTLVCCPASRAQEVGLALGAQAGEARLRAVFREAGFREFRRATETPFNLIFEARP